MICLLVCFKKTLIGPARVLSSSAAILFSFARGLFRRPGPCQALVHHVGTRPFFEGDRTWCFCMSEAGGTRSPQFRLATCRVHKPQKPKIIEKQARNIVLAVSSKTYNLRFQATLFPLNTAPRPETHHNLPLRYPLSPDFVAQLLRSDCATPPPLTKSLRNRAHPTAQHATTGSIVDHSTTHNCATGEMEHTSRARPTTFLLRQEIIAPSPSDSTVCPFYVN